MTDAKRSPKEEEERRRAALLLGGVAMAALAGVAWIGWQQRIAAAELAAQQQLSALIGCMLGPIDAQAQVADLLRARELGAVEAHDSTWPERCVGTLDALRSELDTAGYTTMSRDLAPLSLVQEDGSPDARAMTTLVESARRAGLAVVTQDDTAPEQPPGLLSCDALPTLFAGEARSERFADGDLHLVGGGRVLSIPSGAPDLASEGPAPTAADAQPFGGVRGERPVVIVPSANGALFRNGERVRDGARAAWTVSGGALVVLQSDGLVDGLAATPIAFGAEPQLVGPYLFARDEAGGVITRDVDGPLVDHAPEPLGPLGPSEGARGCRTSRIAAVALDAAHVALRNPSTTAWHVEEVEVAPSDVALDCFESILTRTWVEASEGSVVVATQACNAEHCDPVVRSGTLPVEGDVTPVATSAGGRVVLVEHRRRADGRDLGIWVRLAQVDELDHTHRAVIVDTAAHCFTGSVEGLRITSRSNLAATVLVDVGGSTVGVTIDPVHGVRAIRYGE